MVVLWRRAEDAPPHSLQRTTNFSWGDTTVEALFEGNISHLAVVHPAGPMNRVDIDTIVTKIMDVDHIKDVPNLVAHYALDDSSRARPGKPYQVWVPKTCKVPM